MSNIKCSGAFIFCYTTQRFLFLYRKHSKNNNVWGLVGGTSEYNETLGSSLAREIQEEIGIIDIEKIIPLETYSSKDNNFFYYTYMCIVKNEFIPILNNEHSGYAWATYKDWPLPLHNGVKKTLNSKIVQRKFKTIFSNYSTT